MKEDFNCGCGLRARYQVGGDADGNVVYACNKYARCKSKDEIITDLRRQLEEANKQKSDWHNMYQEAYDEAEALRAEVERLTRIIQMDKTHQMFADLEAEYALVRDNLCSLQAKLSAYEKGVEVITQVRSVCYQSNGIPIKSYIESPKLVQFTGQRVRVLVIPKKEEG